MAAEADAGEDLRKRSRCRPPPGAEHVARRPNLDLDKAWEPLHFLLTGTALEGEEPACYLARGGEELAEQLDDELGDEESV